MKILCTFKKLVSLKKYDKAMLMLLSLTLFLFSCSSESEFSGGYGHTYKAFIFSLSNKEDLKPFKSNVTDPSRAIYRYPDYGPTFGRGHDLHITNQANSYRRSYTNFGYSYSIPSGVTDRYTILAGSFYFTPDDWEVFYLA